MKFSAAVLFAATATAAAAAVGKRDVAFSVSGFSAGCARHSSICVYHFELNSPGVETIECSAPGPASPNGELPEIKRGKCTDASTSFAVAKVPEGLNFSVLSGERTASHLIPNSELVTTNEPDDIRQNYNGPKNFDLTI
ncbi:uncharacterized protein F4812DRAFT_290367 [Daldinia caldariorum]|uniref:uncharacterized protein n=1 Tax=Daldinia caldariorum TaxID=326644 RepID=UPI00200860D9|nr:uncharacterized protein F4812DRAFT_290367 [Daldinia caldariorum]KAI1463034.1 hypothetical protein F4812DRAFT_290367 [Daldinia caldariorum]